VCRIEGDARPLPPGVELAAYRIIQEALTNARKHAAGASARVLVTYERDRLSLLVEDDGSHGSVNGDGTGHGIVGMRERASLYGGWLEAGPGSDGGFLVRARLPVEVRDS
jgi:signal transduction histidine kinase